MVVEVLPLEVQYQVMAVFSDPEEDQDHHLDLEAVEACSCMDPSLIGKALVLVPDVASMEPAHQQMRPWCCSKPRR